MKIKSVHVQNFKRFTELEIVNIPETAKLVMLIGSNGSGKTSLFEAFNFWILPVKPGTTKFQRDYHIKSEQLFKPDLTDGLAVHKTINLEFFDKKLRPYHDNNDQSKKAFYIRTAYRHEPTFRSSQLDALPPLIDDETHPNKMIDIEERVSDNYRRIVGNLVHDVFDDSQNPSTSDLRDKTLGMIRQSTLNVFDDLVLTSVGHPLTNGTFLFEKGTSRNFPYVNLSSGEKATFDLLLDFTVKKQAFDDTVYCFDEPDLHMHTKVQGRLLAQLYDQLPEKCQLWIATHSIGMMRKAFELYQQNPDEVVFLDFDDKDFDQSVVMEPAQVDRTFWKKVFAVALDDLAELVAPSQIIFCEGNSDPKSSTFDAEIYDIIFSPNYPDTQFVPFDDANKIETYSQMIGNTFRHIFSSTSAINTWSVIDRDDMTQAEIASKEQDSIRVLSRRHIEAYLWDDEILTKLCDELGQADKVKNILNGKSKLINELRKRNKPADDIKAISGHLHTHIKKKLQLRQGAKTKEAFSKEFLAPLITPDTQVYQELEQDIFGT